MNEPHKCLLCGKAMVSGEIRGPIFPTCPSCAETTHLPIHPHWLSPSPIEIHALKRDAYDIQERTSSGVTP